METSKELRDILNLTNTFGKDDEFKQAIRDSSIEIKDEFLRFISAPSSQRRFVEEERQRHAERIQAAELARRHQELVTPHPLVWWALWIAILSLGVAILAWFFPREPQASGQSHGAHSQGVQPP
jgi:hypothetical protein